MQVANKLAIDYSFPKGSTLDGRSFLCQWLVQFPWLSYSSRRMGHPFSMCYLLLSSPFLGTMDHILVCLSRLLTAFTTSSISIQIMIKTLQSDLISYGHDTSTT